MTEALLFDDDKKIRNLLAHRFGDARYGVTQAENGSEAFKQAVQHIPDIIPLDVMKPGTDGLEV